MSAREPNVTLREPVLVVGLGASGLSTIRFLNERGIVPGAMDTRADAGVRIQAEGLEVAAVTTGQLDAQLLRDAGTIILSPGLPRELPEVVAAEAAGVEVIGDIELFARAVSAPVAAITGSNGKSTVTTMLRDMAAFQGLDVRAGGNLAPPALDLVTSQEPDLYVLELSSFQLESTSSLRPAAAAILNLSEDHLDRYTGMPAYIDAKLRILYGAAVGFIGEQCVGAMEAFGHAGIGAHDVSVLREGEPGPTEYGLGAHGGETWLMHGDEPLMAVAELPVPGRHNAFNALAAWALGAQLGLKADAMRAALRQFKGLSHRCELVAAHDGVRFINDSKGTNVGATVAAIEGLVDDGGIVLICGGEGKGADFAPLADAIAKHVDTVVLIGRDADLIAVTLSDATPRVHAATLEEAVATAAQAAGAGDCVLMSPACASFDMFDNYVVRGERYREIVLAFTGGGGA